MGKGRVLTQIASVLVELLGIAAITAGFALIAPFLGLIVGGVLLVIIGMAIDPPRRAGRRADVRKGVEAL